MTQEVWTIRRVLQWAVDDLKSRGTDTPRLDAELLLGHVLGQTRIGLITDPERPLSKDELGSYRELHRRRRNHEPIAYMLGVREFYGRPFRVDRRVLIPRPDTETLVEVALRHVSVHSVDTRVLDLCTGSGCVAISIAKERPTWRVFGSDISEDAIVVARSNALRLGAIPNSAFFVSDLFDSIPRGTFDVVTANPPYIDAADREGLDKTITDFEPHVALFGGADGLDIVRRIAVEASNRLEPGGLLAMEIGAGQADRTAALLQGAGYVDVARTRDLGGIERVVSGRRPPKA